MIDLKSAIFILLRLFKFKFSVDFQESSIDMIVLRIVAMGLTICNSHFKRLNHLFLRDSLARHYWWEACTPSLSIWLWLSGFKIENCFFNQFEIFRVEQPFLHEFVTYFGVAFDRPTRSMELLLKFVGAKLPHLLRARPGFWRQRGKYLLDLLLRLLVRVGIGAYHLRRLLVGGIWPDIFHRDGVVTIFRPKQVCLVRVVEVMGLSWQIPRVEKLLTKRYSTALVELGRHRLWVHVRSVTSLGCVFGDV